MEALNINTRLVCSGFRSREIETVWMANYEKRNYRLGARSSVVRQCLNTVIWKHTENCAYAEEEI